MGQSSLDKIPDYLKTYVVDQNYEKYTFQDHAAWRFVLRQSREYFAKHAHPIYLEGLEETGIPITRIPDISEMDAKLQKYGWGALCITGFIPSAAFLDFLSKKILPIASDMRTVEHIHYTPAPDIVHEAAGHAPIIADAEYRDYLSRYAFLASRAIYSDEDINVYEAIRLLSDLKENPDATPKQIEEAEKSLQKTVDAVSWVTESAKVLRMSWWTTEYGLLGDCENSSSDSLKIYGAGLLSSVGESLDVYTDGVKKIPLSLDCVEMGIDITEPQPQLYVARDIAHMNEVLNELEETMAFKKGGLDSCLMAQKAKTVTTTELDSQVQVSGVLSEVRESGGKPYFLKWSTKCQVASNRKELDGQGVSRHPEGFSTPVGMWKKVSKKPSELTEAELSSIGIEIGKNGSIEFESGICVSGQVDDLVYLDGKLGLITWSNASASLNDEVLFDPSWGPFDMLVGTDVVSVFGGPSDWSSYGEYNIGNISSQPGRQTPYTKYELELFEAYGAVRSLREAGLDESNIEQMLEIANLAANKFKKEWLLSLEVCEVAVQNAEQSEALTDICEKLKRDNLDPSSYEKGIARMIERGLTLMSTPD